MQRLSILIHQERPFHLMLMHQAFNALGVFDVQVSDTLARTRELLVRKARIDLLVLDHAMRPEEGRALLELLAAQQRVRALLFVGRPHARGCDLGQEARGLRMWVLGELAWPLSVLALRRRLQLFRSGRDSTDLADRKTVISVEHAH
ncbi:histidine kinase [Pseudomonas sp. X10]